MQAAVLESPGSMLLVDHAEPADPGPGEALVAVRRVGICGTDHHAYRGMQNFFVYPRVLGHELAVEVLAVGAGVTRVATGRSLRRAALRVLRDLPGCQRGRANCCERIDVLGVTQDGGLRERMVVPASHLFTDPELTLDQLVLVETLGVGWHAVARAQPQPDDSVLVLGAGPIGLAVAQAARCRVDLLVVADVSAERVAFAEACGPRRDPRRRRVRANDCWTTTAARCRPLVFDATGSRASMEAAFGLTGSCGTARVRRPHDGVDHDSRTRPFHARELDLRALAERDRRRLDRGDQRPRGTARSTPSVGSTTARRSPASSTSCPASPPTRAGCEDGRRDRLDGGPDHERSSAVSHAPDVAPARRRRRRAHRRLRPPAGAAPDLVRRGRSSSTEPVQLGHKVAARRHRRRASASCAAACRSARPTADIERGRVGAHPQPRRATTWRPSPTAVVQR